MAKEILDCSFCGRKKPETNLLIAGINAHIRSHKLNHQTN